jgi:hypothetical protein
MSVRSCLARWTRNRGALGCLLPHGHTSEHTNGGVYWPDVEVYTAEPRPVMSVPLTDEGKAKTRGQFRGDGA